MQPVFIGGLGRSGTTLLADMMGFHEDVSPIYETDFVLAMARHLFVDSRDDTTADKIEALMDRWTAPLPMRPDNKRPYERFVHGPHHILFERDFAMARTRAMLEHIDTRPVLAFRQLIFELFDAHCQIDGKTRWINKTPLYLQWIPSLHLLFPNLLFVHIVRDGRDVAASVLTRPWGPRTVEEAAQWWSKGLQAGHRFAEAQPDRYVEIRYEDLLREPGRALAPVYARMGLAVPPDLVERYTSAGGQLDPGRIGGFRDALTESDVARFTLLAGDGLERCGYLEDDALLLA